MNNPNVSNGHDRTSAAPVLMGFVLGAAVGAGIALLFAPASGADTRHKIGEAAGKIRGSLSDRIHDTKNRLGELRSDVGSAIDSGRKAFSEVREARTTSPTATVPE